MNDSEELTEADDIDPSLIEEVEPDYHYPTLRHNFHWITRIYKFHQFSSQVCAMNPNFVVKRAPVERHWFWLLEKRLKDWPQAPKSTEEKEDLLRLAFEQCKLPVIESFWAERAMKAGDPSVAQSSIDADFTISQCIEMLAFTQDDFRNPNGSILAVVPNQTATDTVSAEQQAINEAEQARLFGESRERTGLGVASGGVSVGESGGVSFGDSGEDVDADGDVAMG
ncbi:uncharacterized protein EAE98_003413 [Botrytis deweyae]|uniref:Uncharacterized protein n=1 Tax=Botrytis deweyae TaxID=2478750 RepID=A0ABQ7ITI6_9HELO|nr:uncharacterized protein EAE98_003413 [Botrytis deweyae]KAF7933704.1 hypothetical protein EAE98_003413 [Botrytis deweyae]